MVLCVWGWLFVLILNLFKPPATLIGKIDMNPEIKRMWINQPSTLQPLHHLHGTNVLAHHAYDHTYVIYFLSGKTVSMHVLRMVLSEGWK